MNLVSEEATRDVLSKQVFLEISQNSQENTCARVSFLTKSATLLKKRLWHTSFPVTYANFLSTPALDDCFYYFMTIGDLPVQKARMLCLETSRREVRYFKHKSQNLLFSFVSNLFTSLNLHLLQCVNYVQFCS